MRSRITVGIAVCWLLAGSAGLRAEDKFFDSNGVKIHYIIEGKGIPVILVHGFAANIQMNWAVPGVVKALAKNYQVIALDNRGHGLSDKPHDVKKYGLEMVEDIVRLMDHLKIKKAHVVGYSMGAMIVNKLLATHPDRLLSATLGGGAATKQEGDARFIKDLTESLDQGRGIAPVMLALTPPGHPKPTPEQLKFLNLGIMKFNDAQALSALVRGWLELAVTPEDLKANKVPTLALVGSLDTLKSRVDALKGRMPHLKIVVIDGADHMNAVFRPEFIKNLQQFLAKHGPNAKKLQPATTGR